MTLTTTEWLNSNHPNFIFFEGAVQHIAGLQLSFWKIEILRFCFIYILVQNTVFLVRFRDIWGSRSYYSFMGHGDFVLYNNTERNFEVGVL